MAYTLNELGDWLATIALAVLVFDQTGDALATTTPVHCSEVPAIAAGPGAERAWSASRSAARSRCSTWAWRSASPRSRSAAGLLPEGNAALNVGFSSMNIAGPAIAGVVVATGSPSLSLALAGALFAGLAPLLLSTHGLPLGTADEAPRRAPARRRRIRVGPPRRAAR
ncbi:MAG TPA: hypothetical protein VNA28_03695 [Solirubrobacteraceae bacterium]|nr:hypothetical protein [Solirubrobacteraceae bacterium]